MNDLKTQIMAHIDTAAPDQVWVPSDFSQLGSRDALDKALQHLVTASQLRRIDRGLSKLLNGSLQGEAIRQDLVAGFHTLPAWMQAIVRELPGCAVPATEAAMSRFGTDRRAHTETFA